ncbi:sensor histidine kinase [Rhodopirellula sp. SWK7]|uniref:sensor histidine kinase n=1 Tax=Rhodopirellula sp. SWK7 TaxID=595460 RepID=UPI0002BFF01F|nr:histidine kinase [Rhodopirellula sp. SWK7]EMI43177.1 signal transduction histidine kinase [Rhodopirellula sp. SWK7]
MERDLHQSMSLQQLEDRLTNIDACLQMLAQPSMRSGVGAIGYRSRTSPVPDQTVEVTIRFETEEQIDQIVLVPAIWRNKTFGFRADGFPVAFHVLVGTGDDESGHVVAQYDADDQLLPRIAPVVIDIEPQKASWIRLVATELSPRAWDGLYSLQFAELLVFSRSENIAMNQHVEATSSDEWAQGPRKQQYLVDGFMPYLMNGFGGEQSTAFVSKVSNDEDIEAPVLSVDLGWDFELERIHFHATDFSDTIPASAPESFAVPGRIIVEGALQSDFSDAVVLIDYSSKSELDTGPIVMQRFPKRECRYVRLTSFNLDTRDAENETTRVIGFAEIELFSDGVNVARHRPFEANFHIFGFARGIESLTDGNNIYGQILPIKQWLRELSQRHEFETERPLIVAELNGRYNQQSNIIRRLLWLVAVLALGTLAVIMIGRVRRRHAIDNTREQIAADVHDELGANLHALSLLADIAHANRASPEKLADLLQRIRDLSRRSGAAARYCSNLLESNGLFENLVHDMRRTSERMMADLHHEITITGEEHLESLSHRNRIDLFLFYKECLANILQHSNATQASTQLVAERNNVRLTVTDNGRGLADTIGSRVPKSLNRRARFLGAQVAAEDLDNQGTRITLQLRPRGISHWYPHKKST